MTERAGAYASPTHHSASLPPQLSGDKDSSSAKVNKVAAPVISGAGQEEDDRKQASKRSRREAQTDKADQSESSVKRYAAKSKVEAVKPVLQPVLGQREIEFKATRVDAQQFKAGLQILRSMAAQGAAVDKGAAVQEDHYLDHPAFRGTDFALYAKGAVSKSLRIRREESAEEFLGGKKENHSLCVKIARKGAVESDHERREYNAPIGNPQETLELFQQLGFMAEKIIQKTRTSFLYEDYEVVFDEVVGLKKSAQPSAEYEQEFSTYIIEVELKTGAEEVEDVPACLAQMKVFIEAVLLVKQYVQEQSGMEKYM